MDNDGLNITLTKEAIKPLVVENLPENPPEKMDLRRFILESFTDVTDINQITFNETTGTYSIAGYDGLKFSDVKKTVDQKS
jgi:hypothetical protein